MINDQAQGDDEMYFNGVDGKTGQYLDAPARAAELAARIVPAANISELADLRPPTKPKLGVLRAVDLDMLAHTGWGVLVREPTDAAQQAYNDKALEQLAPLLRLRREQTKREIPIFDVKDGETREQFLARHHHPIGPIDTRLLPYYMLIVAEPEMISFEFQCSLDVPAAVGRLCFDNLGRLGEYAQRIADTERRGGPPTRSLDLIATSHDKATQLSATKLVGPLAERLARSDWRIETLIGANAPRARMLAHLGGPDAAAITFVAAHGLELSGAACQRTRQGALVCQEWSGPGVVPSSDELITAADVVNADFPGSICFLFACYGLGTPRLDSYPHLRRAPRELASRAFVSSLAQTMVERGAIAVIGHVERAWGWSFELDGVSQLGHFETALEGMMNGARIGGALENFGQRHADATTLLARELAVKKDRKLRPRYISQLWTIAVDAGEYALFGDPAARLFEPALR